MTVRKEIGLGVTLEIGATATSTSTSFTSVAGILSAAGPDGSPEDIETSTLDSTAKFKEFKRGLVDPGTLNLTLAYGSTDSSQQKLVTAYGTGKLHKWRISYPSTSTPVDNFNGYVASIGRAIERSAMITRTVGIKVSGDPGYQST